MEGNTLLYQRLFLVNHKYNFVLLDMLPVQWLHVAPAQPGIAAENKSLPKVLIQTGRSKNCNVLIYFQMLLTLVVLIGLSGHLIRRIDPEVTLLCRRFDDPFEPGEIIGRGIAIEAIQQVFAEALAQVLRDLDGSQKPLT